MPYKNGLEWILALKIKKLTIWQFGICVGHCTTDRREYTLSLGPIKGAGFKIKVC